MEKQELSKMTLQQLWDYNLKLTNEFEKLDEKLKWAKEFKMIYNNSENKTIKEKLENNSNIISERHAKYEIMNCSKQLKKLEKEIDDLENFLNNRG